MLGTTRSSRCPSISIRTLAISRGSHHFSRQISGGAEPESLALDRAAFAELAAEASAIERTALDLDRHLEREQAVAVYRQAAERMARAAALCPAGNPDRSVLAKHCGEIHGRVVYLESLQGDEVVPPEHHIGTATLGPHIERQDSDGFQVIGELHLEPLGGEIRGCQPVPRPSWGQKAVSAAAVSVSAHLGT